MAKKTIRIHWAGNEYRDIVADCRGCFGIHRSAGAEESSRKYWTLTHIPTGYAIYRLCGTKKTLQHLLRDIGAAATDTRLLESDPAAARKVPLLRAIGDYVYKGVKAIEARPIAPVGAPFWATEAEYSEALNTVRFELGY